MCLIPLAHKGREKPESWGDRVRGEKVPGLLPVVNKQDHFGARHKEKRPTFRGCGGKEVPWTKERTPYRTHWGGVSEREKTSGTQEGLKWSKFSDARVRNKTGSGGEILQRGRAAKKKWIAADDQPHQESGRPAAPHSVKKGGTRGKHMGKRGGA